MGPMEMVVAIVAIGAGASIVRAKHGYGRDYGRRGRARFMAPLAPIFGARDDDDDRSLADENAQLRDEMRGLKERIQVLERLATDDESDARRLDREIEKLRGNMAAGKDLTRE